MNKRPPPQRRLRHRSLVNETSNVTLLSPADLRLVRGGDDGDNIAYDLDRVVQFNG